jgi:hypothetical protein
MHLKSIGIGLVFCFSAAVAQQPDEGAAKQERIGALKEWIANNRAALKQYTWTEATQISVKGEVKKEVLRECQYGPDGKVQRTPAAGASQPQRQAAGRGGPVRRAIGEKKVEEVKDYAERVAELVHEYAPPDPQKIEAARAAGNVAVTLARPVTTLTIRNYAKPGDLITVGFDVTAKAIASLSVESYLDDPKDDALKMSVTFGRLPDGTGYASQLLLGAPGKKIEVKVTNSNYRKLAE